MKKNIMFFMKALIWYVVFSIILGAVNNVNCAVLLTFWLQNMSFPDKSPADLP